MKRLEKIAEHLSKNMNVVSYQGYISTKMYDYDYHKGCTFHLDKLTEGLIKKVEIDFDLAEKAINTKLKFDKPTTGDFIKINGKTFRIALFMSDDEFQYTTKDSSFHLSSDGHCSYSGGFDFSEGSRLNVNDFELTKKRLEGRFWIWSNGYAAGSNDAYLKGDFKVWRYKAK